MIVVDAALLRVALAGILGLVGDRIAAGRIERVEQRHAGQEHADRAGSAARPRRKLRVKRQRDLHRLLPDGIRIAVVALGVVGAAIGKMPVG